MSGTILFFGDVIGALGRKGLVQALPELRKRYTPDLIIANVENLAHGAGVTAKTLEELMTAGVDIFTGGNHSWDNPLGTPLFDDPAWQTRLIVPLNYGGAKNGQGQAFTTIKDAPVMVVNLMGQIFSHPETRSPFETLERLLKKYNPKPNVILVDLHAETTAEKEAFGHFADGKVSAVLGTHTHVPTADAKILPCGTAYVTDVGRCGAYDSVIGFEKQSVIKRFIGQTERKYELPTQGICEVNGIVIRVDLTSGHTLSLDRIHEMIEV